MKTPSIILIIILLILSAFAYQHTNVARPPQYVVISFDGAGDLTRWQQLTDFVKQTQLPIHFTFFLSGTNLLTDANKNKYQALNQQPGFSNIPFGGSIDEVKKRVSYINQFYHLGNEFGSHVAGHFDGEKWSANEWDQEFASFNSLFLNFNKNNQLPESIKFDFPLSEFVGFRAPYLSINRDLYTVLNQQHYRYDASGISKRWVWPYKINGIWNFSLVQLTIDSTQLQTISMDYNFYMAQSNAKDDLANATRYQEQMYQTYLKYFLANYTGNRAPIRIGHHFSTFQGNAYNQALLQFVNQICRVPEVRCVSFVELADYMDKLPLQTRVAYQLGHFEHASSPVIPMESSK